MRYVILALLLLVVMPAAWPASQRSAEQAVAAALPGAPDAARTALVALLVTLQDGDALGIQVGGTFATFTITGDEVQALKDEPPPGDADEPGGMTEGPTAETPMDAALFVEQLNAARQEAGLGPLELKTELLAVAAAHSDDMAQNNYIAHEGSDGRDPFQRLQDAGIAFRAAAENVTQFTARDDDPNQIAATAFKSWRDSAPHQKNMMNGDYTQCGVAFTIRNGTCWGTLVLIQPG